MSSLHAFPFDQSSLTESPDSCDESDTETAVAQHELNGGLPRGRSGRRRGRGFRGRGRGQTRSTLGPSSSEVTHHEDEQTRSARPRAAPNDHGANERPGKPARRKLKNESKRIFGITHREPEAMVHDNYEHLYPEDEFGEEMGPEARVWRVYLDEAQRNDADMVAGWKDTVDVLLVFAGLFSAVVTTLVIQTSQKLDRNFGEISASLLTELVALQRAAAGGVPADTVPPAQLTLHSPPNFGPVDKWINGLWFTSLALSLVTALAATLVKQWIQHYVSLPSGTPRERVRLHQFRYIGIQRWAVPVIVGILPLLIHAALFSFFAGLITFLSALNTEIAWSVGVISIDACVLYLVTCFIPLRYPQCPYKTPLIAHGHVFGSRFASIVYDSFKSITHRVIPGLLLHFSHHKSRGGRLWNWCKSRLEDKIPRHEILTLNEMEVRAAQTVGICTDMDAIRWLLGFSSNHSVRSIALQALSGIHDARQREYVKGTHLVDELKAAVRVQFQLAVNQYYRDHDPEPLAHQFAASKLFTGLERLLRTTILIFDFHVFSSRNVSKVIVTLLRSAWEEIDEQRLTTYTAYAFLTHDPSSKDPSLSLSNAELVGLANNSFISSETHQHHASKYPLVWKGYFTILQRFARIFYGNASPKGFLDTYYHLVPLLDTLTLSELSRPGLATPENTEHLEVVRSMARFAYIVAGNSLTKTMAVTVPVPMHDKGFLDFRSKDGCAIHLQFWVIIMKILMAACKESEPFMFRLALSGHLGRLSLYCRWYPLLSSVVTGPDFSSILAVLNDLYHAPFLHETVWESRTYMELYFLYLTLEEHHDTGPVLITPLLNMIPTHITERSFVTGLFKALKRNMKNPSPYKPLRNQKRVTAITRLVQGIIDCLLQLHEAEEVAIIASVFDVILDLNWVEEITRHISALTHRDPPAWYWRPILPLLHLLLEISLAYSQLSIAEDSTDIHRCAERIHQEMTKSSTLENLCEMYICLPIPNHFPFEGISTPTPEARVLLRLAQSSKHEPGWYNYVSHLARAFTEFYGSKRFERHKKRWSATGYDQYENVVSFVDELKETLGLAGEEYEMPWIKENCNERLRAGDTMNEDTELEFQSTAEKIFEPIRNIVTERSKDHAELNMV